MSCNKRRREGGTSAVGWFCMFHPSHTKAEADPELQQGVAASTFGLDLFKSLGSRLEKHMCAPGAALNGFLSRLHGYTNRTVHYDCDPTHSALSRHDQSVGYNSVSAYLSHVHLLSIRNPMPTQHHFFLSISSRNLPALYLRCFLRGSARAHVLSAYLFTLFGRFQGD